MNGHLGARDAVTHPPRRAEIWWVDLAPAVGSEADSRRPAVVVSNDGANSAAASLGRGVVTVVPLTTTLTRVLPFQVVIPASEEVGHGLRQDSKAQAEQVRSVDVRRLVSRAGRLRPDTMARLEDALRLHLGW